MIREGRKIPGNALEQIPRILESISTDDAVVALFIFGSGAKGRLKPLSDLDFGVLLSKELGKKERFQKQLALIGFFNETFKTDEVDLVLMNDAPIRFSYNILKDGKLHICSDRTELVNFVEKTVKFYLDFRFFRDAFDREYLKGVGYVG